MVNLLVAAALAAASPPAAPAPAAPAPEPAMFVVRDADTTVYIFGTFHALDGQADWFNERGPRRLRDSPTSWCSKPWCRRARAGPSQSERRRSAACR